MINLDTLRQKPDVTERKCITITINEDTIINGNEQKLDFVDKRQSGFDINSLLKRMSENKVSKVYLKPVLESEKNIIEKQAIIKKKIKSVTEKPKLIIEEEEGEEGLGENVLEEVIPIIEPPKKKERRTKKEEKGIAVIGPETVVEIGEESIMKRLPRKAAPINIRVSNYYMNNRKHFINFINSMFEPYKQELDENSENISCDNIGNTKGDFSLLTHQKIVRDYMNLFTPYRGLLLFHGLGSGKTCTSIAIAEGMKDSKKVIVMTPKSLRANYMEELKKCGDLMYKLDQFWEWISVLPNNASSKPSVFSVEILSTVLNLPQEYIRKNKGAWLVNITKPESNYSKLSGQEQESLNAQINLMIESKYTFINYNGLRLKRLGELTAGFTKNLFDDKIVIIDEAHNLISRIVNKIKKEKPIPEDNKGVKEVAPKFLSTKLYEFLLSANNARIVLLTGTPIINYPNEFGILFNILRGYIKTWEIPLDVKTTGKVDRNTLHEMLMGEKTLDYLDYSPSSKILTITRNPFGFKNKIKKESGYHGVANNKKNEEGKTEFDVDVISDDDFERKIINILKRNNIDVVSNGIKIKNNKALPDTMELFEGQYIDSVTKKIKNADALKSRILGLTSFFKSAQESLLPRFNRQLGVDYHVVRVPMSNFQFKIYENARIQERKTEKPSKKQSVGINELYKDSNSTYRIFSRLFCNYVMPDRPIPKSGGGKFEYYTTIRKDLIVKGKNYGKLVKEETIDGVEYVSFINNVPIPAFPSLGTNSKPIQEAVEKVEKRQKIIESMVVNEEEGEIENEDFVMLKKENIIEGKDYGKLIREQTVDGIEYVIFSKKDKTKSGPSSKLKPLEPVVNLEEGNLEEGDITNVLKEANKYEDTEDIDDEKEGEVEGDEILDKIGGISYKERIDAALKYIKEESNTFLTPEGLEIYSPKYLKILENIKDPGNIGLNLVYSQFRTLEGIGIFCLVLEKNGFARFKVKRNPSTNVWEMDMSEADLGKPTYALYTGTETPEERAIILKIYNGEWDSLDPNMAAKLRKIANNNNMGEIIKVLMITSSGSEGINLKNTRYVHIMEPYWHPVRTEQVIGRARRICSHSKLPIALQTVEVFVYLMEFTQEQLDSKDAIELKRKDLSKIKKLPVTSDQLLYEISEIKANLSSQLTDAIKASSFDCNLYNNGNCVNYGETNNTDYAYVPDYSKQPNDSTTAANKRQVEWTGKPVTISGVEYVYRRMANDVLNIYDKSSYLRGSPVLIGTLEVNEQGNEVFKQIV